MANSLALVQGRLRRHAPKVRTGCVTCKARKIRCDETKPSCDKCTSTGRRCDGYVALRPLLFEIPQDKDERWGFYYFRDRTSRHLLSFAHHDFWNRLVIQAGYSRVAVRHAMVAIASYHESVDHPDHIRRRDRQRFALRQYNKAIRSIVDAGIHGDAEDALLASILFTFLESVRGSLSNALLHLRGGLLVLSEWRLLHGSRDKVGTSSQLIKEHLAPILGHLQSQAATLMPIRPSQQNISSTGPPECFKTLQESQFYFNEIVHGLCGRFQSIHECDTWPYSDQGIIHESRILLCAWYDSFTRFLCEKRESICFCSKLSPSCHFEIGVYYLQMQYWAAIIRLESKIHRSEMEFDNHLPKFQVLLDVTTRLVEMLGIEEASGVDICLGFRIEYLAVTGFIACRCRDPIIRRHAIGLMRFHLRTEGMWRNTVSADLAEFIMASEEAGAITSNPSSCHDIPEHSRMQLLACNFLSHDQKSEIFRIAYGVLDPDLIKIRVIRSGIKPADQDLETFWIDRRPEQSLSMHKRSLPDDVSGLFPQTIETESNLWRLADGRKLAEYLERSAASHICGNVKGIQGGHQ